MEMDMEGHKMFEMDHSTVLGLTLNSQLTYDFQKWRRRRLVRSSMDVAEVQK